MRTKIMVAAAITGAALAVTGAATAAAQAEAPAQDQTQMCTLSYFTVTWSTAGVYDRPNGNVLYTKSSGDQVTGPTGGTSGGWTTVYKGGGGQAFMKDAALRFDYCV